MRVIARAKRVGRLEEEEAVSVRRETGAGKPGIEFDVGVACLIDMMIDPRTTPAARAVIGICLAFIQAEPKHRITLAEMARMAGCTEDAVKQRLKDIREWSRKRFAETAKRLQRELQ